MLQAGSPVCERKFVNRLSFFHTQTGKFLSLVVYSVLMVIAGALWSGTPASAQPLYVKAWGLNYHGEAVVPSGLTGVAAISAGLSHNVVLKNDV